MLHFKDYSLNITYYIVFNFEQLFLSHFFCKIYWKEMIRILVKLHMFFNFLLQETSSISLFPEPITIISEEFTVSYYNAEYGSTTVKLNNPAQKNATIDVDFIVNKTLPPNLLMSIIVMREEDGSYTLDGRRPIKQNLCKYMKYDNFLYPSFLKHGNLPATCPFLEGNQYYIKNYKIPVENIPAVMKTGKYKFEFEIEAENVKLVQFRWLGTLKK